MTLPFGKYRGEPLETVPAGYLAWLLEECSLRPALEAAVRDQLADRLGFSPTLASTSPRLSPPCELVEPVRELIHAGFRALTRTRHPDVGGSNAAMRAVLEAHDWLRETVGAA